MLREERDTLLFPGVFAPRASARPVSLIRCLARLPFRAIHTAIVFTIICSRIFHNRLLFCLRLVWHHPSLTSPEPCLASTPSGHFLTVGVPSDLTPWAFTPSTRPGTEEARSEALRWVNDRSSVRFITNAFTHGLCARYLDDGEPMPFYTKAKLQNQNIFCA